ncbi:MAG: CapA family protein [Clostridia bacterium]
MRNGNIVDESLNEKVKTSKNTKRKIIFFIWLVICIFVYFQIFELIMYTLGKKEKSNMLLYNGVNSVISFISPKNKQIVEENTLTIAALGDIYFSENMDKYFEKDSRNDYSFVKEELSKYNIVLASLNSPILENSLTKKNIYSSSETVLKLLKSIGVSTVATAGNHSMDKNEKGIVSTIDALKKFEINQIGINSNSKKNKPYIIDKNNIKVGVLSYTTKTNIKTNKGKEYLVNKLTEENLKEDIQYCKTQNVDFVISYLNASNEDGTMISNEQTKSAEMLFSAGVNIVLGTGSKVVQSSSEDLYEITSSTKNHIYTIYSLGDFIGDMNSVSRKVSVGADIKFNKIVKKDKKGKVLSSTSKMLLGKPISFYTSVTENKITNYPIESSIQSYNNNKLKLDTKDFNAMKNAEKSLKEILK